MSQAVGTCVHAPFHKQSSSWWSRIRPFATTTWQRAS